MLLTGMDGSNDNETWEDINKDIIIYVTGALVSKEDLVRSPDEGVSSRTPWVPADWPSVVPVVGHVLVRNHHLTHLLLSLLKKISRIKLKRRCLSQT